MKTIDARITDKEHLSAEEYGEALKKHYSHEQQRVRLEQGLDVVASVIRGRKSKGFNFTEMTNFFKMVDLDQEHVDMLVEELVQAGYKVEYANTKEKDEFKIAW